MVITAGPTWEPVDPVRVLANRSSGRMGFALARAAVRRGASVHLVRGPLAIDPPIGVEVEGVETAVQMEAATRRAVDGVDVVIMAAAVADFRPASPSA